MASKDLLKIISINVNEIAKSSRSNRILTELSLNSADIFFLQETHLHDSIQIETLKKQWKGVSIWEAGTHNSCGVAILFNSKASVSIENVQLSGCGRYIAADCTINRINLRLINVYSPTKEGPRRIFFNSLLPIISTNKKIVLGGDFSCVDDLLLDKSQTLRDKSRVSRTILKELTDKANLIDVYRHKHPNGRETTCFNAAKNTNSRIDRVHIDASLIDTILKTEHIANSFSDHCSVVLSLKTPKSRGRGYWKCNVKTLDDPYFLDDFKYLWASLTSCPRDDINLEWWESCKLEFRKLIVYHSRRIVVSRNIAKSLISISRLI
jgi:exonuclease III